MMKQIYFRIAGLIALLFYMPYLSAEDSRFDYDQTYSLQKWERQDGRLCSSVDPVELNSFKKNFGAEGFFCQDYDKYIGYLESTNPLSGGPYTSKFHFYKTLKPGVNPVVLIVPVIEGVTLVETSLAKWFAKQGVNAVIAELPENISDTKRPVSDIDGFLIRTTVSLRVILDFTTSLNFVDENRVASYGGSMGGIRLFLAMGVDERFQNGAIVVGGGNIPEILARSNVGVISKLKDAKIKEYNLKNTQEYEDLLISAVNVEPLDAAHNIDPDKVFMILSSKDKSVPTANQMDALEAIGTEHVKFLSVGHISTVVSSLYYRSQILDFFKKRWADQ